jgi:hypothetical protein
MLYKDRIRNLTAFYPELTRVWIKTDNPRTQLKSVWMNLSALRKAVDEHSAVGCDTEAAELTEDHLLLAAYAAYTFIRKARRPERQLRPVFQQQPRPALQRASARTDANPS